MRTAIEALASIRNRFSPDVTRHKLALMATIQGRLPHRWSERRALHDILLFIQALPDTPDVAVAACVLFDRLTADLIRSDPGWTDAPVLASGIAGTECRVSLTFDAMRWLVHQAGSEIELALDADGLFERIEHWLPLLVGPAQRDGLYDESRSTLEWLRLAAGGEPGALLRWLLSRLADRVTDGAIRDQFFEAMEIEARWRLCRPEHCRTGARLLPRSPATVGQGLIREFDAAAILRQPVARGQRLTRPQAQRVIDSVRACLYSRQRETDAVTYPNPGEVTRFELERGVDLYIVGLAPERRLPIESFFGYVIARNAIPVGYGGGWVLLDRCEIGTNVFDEHRGGESAWLFAQVLRVYRAHFNVGFFRVEPFQIGADNPEAIRSGAFWFYYRLGFRPDEPTLAEEAARQWSQIRANRSHRTPPGVLRRFAAAPVTLNLQSPGHRMTETPVQSLALRLTELLQGQADSESDVRRDSSRRLLQRLDINPSKRASSDQLAWFERLSVLFARIPGVEHWPHRHRAQLARALLLKGGPRERDYVLALQRVRPLQAALRAFIGPTPASEAE